MLKNEQLEILKDKYKDILKDLSRLHEKNPDDYKFAVTWLKNDIQRLEKEIENNSRNIYNQKIVVINLPEDLEEKAKNNAKRKGFVKGGEGSISPYVVELIKEDLEDKNKLWDNIKRIRNINFGSKAIKKNTIYLPVELQEKARERSLELGFIYGGKGNLSQYIRYLIALDE